MLRAEVCATFKVVYRGHDIEVSRAPAGWQAGVYPRSADLPILRRSEICAGDQDEAVIKAMDRVDHREGPQETAARALANRREV
jgi:hypothetical protein